MTLPEGMYGSDLEIIRRHWKVQPGDVCVDAGFGPGGWTLAALDMGGWVYAFDPAPEALRTLPFLLTEHCLSRCCIVPCGLWSSTGKRRFQANTFFTNHPDMPDAPVISLDDFFDGFNALRLDWVNLDVEGAEIEVIKGARKTIIECQPTIIIETHGDTGAGIRKELAKMPYEYDIAEDGVFLICSPRFGVEE